jgi:hypothetical protein
VRSLFDKFFGQWGTTVITSGQIGGMIELYSTFVDQSITKETLMTDSENDFTSATGLGGHSGAHDPNLTNESPLCFGGDPTKCTEPGIAGGVWGQSTAIDPVLLRYKVSPLTSLMSNATGFSKDVSHYFTRGPANTDTRFPGNSDTCMLQVIKSVTQGFNCYVQDKKMTVKWSWDVTKIGGNCSTAATSGFFLSVPGTCTLVSLAFVSILSTFTRHRHLPDRIDMQQWLSSHAQVQPCRR